ncbi:MAG TPA: sulfate adenylyltransferase [Thermoplasmata archaeon]|nr:sulfate adenylyltransferase [Thermoplasmata archaeon]
MIAPHGGRLVDRLLTGPAAARRAEEARELPLLRPSIDEIYDAEKVGLGAYSPLEGFLDRAELESVLARTRLPNDLPWSIPILLAPAGRENAEVLAGVGPGDAVALADPAGAPFAIVTVSEKFPYDKAALAQATYGTTDPKHPNVGDLAQAGDTAVGGRIELLHRLDLPTGASELSPVETRAEFERRGWKRVAAYQCRNPPHTAHEYLQRLTLEREDVDGLLIHPVVGRLKKGDYRPDVILAAYRALLSRYYPDARVLLAAFSITMRYAGPKAALFLAIVRQNFGCASYIVGRDQAGVGSYYDPYACHRIFDELPLGIQPLRYEETFFCRTCGWMATAKTCAHPKEDRLDTSQTRIRKALTEGVPPPREILRPEVFEILARPGVVLTE